MVALTGLEPVRHRCREILSLLRLPIPPQGRMIILCQNKFPYKSCKRMYGDLKKIPETA